MFFKAFYMNTFRPTEHHMESEKFTHNRRNVKNHCVYGSLPSSKKLVCWFIH